MSAVIARRRKPARAAPGTGRVIRAWLRELAAVAVRAGLVLVRVGLAAGDEAAPIACHGNIRRTEQRHNDGKDRQDFHGTLLLVDPPARPAAAEACG